MAKMSKAQYELLTEALGYGVAEVRRRDSPIMENAADILINKLAGELKYDNENFNIKQFKDGIKSVADLARLTDKGIH